MILALFLCASDFFTEQSQQGHAAAMVQQLTDEVGPRPSGSQGAARAVEWAVGAMQKAGLKNVRKELVRTRRWVRVSESAEVVSPAQRLHVTALGGSVAGSVTGEVIEVSSLDQIKTLQATGKIVFVNQVWSGYGAASRIRWRAASEAEKVGASAVLIRSAGEGYHRLPHTGGMGAAKIPAAALAWEDADLLHRLRKPVVVRLSIDARDEGLVDSANVVGEVPGREKPDEIVLVGAHLDSWDLGTGALDDGAGCGIALDVGRIAALRAPRRTVRVVLFMNEELGLDGAKAYATAHARDHHVMAIEADDGTGKPVAFATVGKDTALLAQWVKPFSSLPVIAGEHGGADLIPLAEAGVAVVNVNQEGHGYFEWHHTAGDTFDKIDPVALAQATAAYAFLTWTAAEAKETLPRAPVANSNSSPPLPH